jgi:dual specificity MAP kinase phosphatase
VQILPHLILGCAKDSSNLSVLRQLGVTAVLNVSHNCPSLFQSQLQYMEIRVPDTYQADLLARLDEAFLFIGEQQSQCSVMGLIAGRIKSVAIAL